MSTTDDRLLFDQLGLSPLASEAEIAERLRDLVADADDARRAFLRDAFDRLTRSPRARFELAMATFLEDAPPTPPSLPVVALPSPEPVRAAASEPARASALEAWLDAEPAAREAATSLGSGYVAVHEDPILAELTDPFLVSYVRRRPT